jgi:3-hydroxyacyl-[acyl-carrier-protein] dehydratase
MSQSASSSVVTVENLRIALTHPCLEGHFPGNPIVPAVVLLDEVLGAIQRDQPGFVVTRLPTAKFLSPLLPDEAFSLRLETIGNEVRFECFTPTRILARGSMSGTVATDA